MHNTMSQLTFYRYVISTIIQCQLPSASAKNELYGGMKPYFPAR